MAIYKCTLFFVSGRLGWTESYYTTQGSHLLADTVARKLAVRRMAICGTGIDLPYIRVSDIDIRGDAFNSDSPGYTTRAGDPAYILIKPVAGAEAADIGSTCTIVNISKAQVTVGRIFMRGLPDAFFTNDRRFIPDANWNKGWSAFTKEYQNQLNAFVVLRKAKSVPANTAPILAANAILGANLHISFAPFVAFNAGDTVAIRGMTTTDGQRFSGNFRVTLAGAGFVEIAKTFPNPQPTFTLLKGTIQNALPQVLSGLELNYENLASTRRAGRPFGGQVGRRKRVPTLR